MTEIEAQLTQHPFWRGKHTFTIRADGYLEQMSRHVYRRRQITVELARIDPTPKRGTHFAISFLVFAGALYALTLLLWSLAIYCPAGSEDRIVFFSASILFIVPGFLCLREFAQRTFDVTVFADSAGESDIVLFTNKPSPEEFNRFVHYLKAAIRRAGGGTNLSATSLAQELHQLSRLRAMGDLTDEEFAQAKERVIQGTHSEDGQQPPA